MHIIRQIASTLQALSDGDVHFCENSKFVDSLGVKSVEIVKICKFKKIIVVTTETLAMIHARYILNWIYFSSPF
jgi:hypothetical protein